MMNDYQTLSQRLAQGKIPLPEALRYATQLGDALRRMHDEGRVHGALTPSGVILNGAGLRLLTAEPATAGEATPYMAPERFHGNPPDTSGDIFSFGAVVYEMLAGGRAFPGETPEAIAESIGNSTPPPIGHPELDRLVAACLSKDRAGRCQSMQYAVMKLKLMDGLERRSGPGVVLRQMRMESRMRAEMQQMESRWTSSLEQQQRVAAEEHSILQQVSEVLLALREQISEIDSRLGQVQDRVAHAEQAAEESRCEIAEQGTMLLDEFRELEHTVNTQAVAIEATRNRLVQTDDLVERVVEALESLQSLVLEQSEERTAVHG